MLPPGTFCARDIIFCPDYYETKSQELFDEIIVPTYCFNEMIEQFEDGEVLYITLYNMRNGKSYMVTLGSPHNDDPSVIFVPQWILDAMEYTEGPVRMDVMDRMEVMDIPAARKIVIAPQDSYAFDIDLRECIERTIVNLHSIQEGCLLPFVDGDVVMVARIQKVEPMTISRIVMGEVEVEFVNLFAKDMHCLLYTSPSPRD